MADPILTDHEIKTMKPQSSLAVRVLVPMDQLDLGALFAAHLPRLHAVAADGGPPYGRYHEFGPTQADIEIGIPVGDVSPDLRDLGDGEQPIEPSELPGGPTAVAIHHGSYETLGPAYDRLHDWIHSQGHEEGPGPWESYLDLPDQVEDEASLRTMLHWPLLER
ncbi:MAG TPA: GyrI-like domain-containing protein [Acidimicrobiia bacterium]|nr:Bacterial transcription activator, effector binding domain [Acidimicrobiia bacterium]HYJ26011.1 GyrI-like domain-containing protein [Acidimicrobiia bacterium]